LTLTVSDVNRSREFYINLLGFKVVAEVSPTRVVIGNEHCFFGLSEPPDPQRRIVNDYFDENRIGLDHLSFTAASRADIEKARAFLDGHGVRHAEIKEVPSFGLVVMTFWDPDGIQLELSAPL
jgi:glyoxylase I family protein